MTFRIIQLAIALVITVFSINANAIIVGDKDWLQVTATAGFSHGDFDAVFDTTTGQCDVTGCTATNGLTSIDLSGYTWASNADVNNLLGYYSSAPGFTSLNTPSNGYIGPTALDLVFTDFSPTKTSSGQPFWDLREVIGWTRNQSGGPSYADYIQVQDAYNQNSAGSFNDYAVLDIVHGQTTRLGIIGGWFYRSATVPEPSILALVALGLAGIGFTRRKKS